ncbi:MAG: restriction endonuclease subunit S, partial [Akkermansia sp.]
MSAKLEQLLARLCPNGVEYVKLSEAVEIQRGKRVVKSQLKEKAEGTYPVYQNSLIPLGYHSEFNFSKGKTFIIVAGAAGEIGYEDREFWAADDCFVFVCDKKISDRYLYHVLLRDYRLIQSKVRRASIPRLSRAGIDNLVIPVPPLEVQNEIVRILDKFTELTAALMADLTAELTARRKQYEYYRDLLLSFDNRNDRGGYHLLSDVFDMRNGYTPSKTHNEYWENGVIPWFRMEDIRENGRILMDSVQHVSTTAVKKGGLFPANSIIVATSATIGEHALILAPFLANQRFTCLSIKAKWRNK